MGWLSQRLNELRPFPDCALELHFNAADSPGVEGFEYIHWHTSSQGERLAECLVKAQLQMSPTQKNRGRKKANFETRGGAFLYKPTCPCVIAEPFFGTSQKEWDLFGREKGQEMLSIIYAKGLASYLDFSFPLPYVDSVSTTNDPVPFSSEISGSIDRIEHELREIKKLL
jgi:N-acetylmuramoyl-L-alanine amidase